MGKRLGQNHGIRYSEAFGLAIFVKSRLAINPGKAKEFRHPASLLVWAKSSNRAIHKDLQSELEIAHMSPCWFNLAQNELETIVWPMSLDQKTQHPCRKTAWEISVRK